MTTAPIRVVLVEDHRVLREGLRSLLDPVADIEVVGEAADLAGVRDVRAEPQVVVTDLLLPDAMDAVVIAGVRERFPDAVVLVLSMVSDPETVEAVLRAGADGYLLKDAASTELVEAIRVVAGGEPYLQTEIAAALARRQRQHDTGLSDRERGVLRLIALGHTNAEIAERLGLSVRTIETERAAIGEKIGAPSRAGLVRYALEHGLLRDLHRP